jgi:protein-disulfide isomerase
MDVMPGSRPNALAAMLLCTVLGYAASAADDIVAVVDGKPISSKELEERAGPQLLELNTKIYEVKEQVLKDMINERLLDVEERRHNLTMQQLLDREVFSRVSPPTSSEVESYYLGVKDRLGQPLEEIRPQLVDFLTESRRRNAYGNYLSQLRQHMDVNMLLAPPRAVIAIDPARVRGPADAPITIVEFSDFECPYCARAEPTLQQLLSKYPTQIRLAYRDFPLDFHPRARASAEASRCAEAQGKFWEYHDILITHQQQLEQVDLSNFATQLGMNAAKFGECIHRGSFASGVQGDIDEAEKLGITGTPAFFINGISLAGAVPLEEFSHAIDEELQRIKRKATVAGGS